MPDETTLPEPVAAESESIRPSAGILDEAEPVLDGIEVVADGVERSFYLSGDVGHGDLPETADSTKPARAESATEVSLDPARDPIAVEPSPVAEPAVVPAPDELPIEAELVVTEAPVDSTQDASVEVEPTVAEAASDLVSGFVVDSSPEPPRLAPNLRDNRVRALQFEIPMIRTNGHAPLSVHLSLTGQQARALANMEEGLRRVGKRVSKPGDGLRLLLEALAHNG